MVGDDRHAAILRRVALVALDEAQAAQRLAQEAPSEGLTRAAFRACVFARRALLRASEVQSDSRKETKMIELSMVMAEAAEALSASLVRFAG